MIKKNIIFFSPSPSVWAHSFPEAVFADNLRKLNFNIKYVFIKNTYKKDQNRIIKGFNFNYTYLDDYVTKKKLLEINKIVDSLKSKTAKEIVKYLYEGIPVGNFALYEPMLNFKTAKVYDFNKKQKKFYLDNIKNCILAISAFKEIFKKNKISAVTVYNSYYGKNRCVRFLAKKYKIKTITIHAGANFENYLKTLLITSEELVDLELIQKNKIWPKLKNISTVKESIEQTRYHFLSSFKSNYSYAYSPELIGKFNLREKFKIKDNQKIILLALSSPDEKQAEKQTNIPMSTMKDFKNTKSLIKFMVNYVKSKKDTFLIIRVHPREYKNKRENYISENYYLLKDFSNKFKSYKNIKFNFPEEKISMYNILPYIDVLVSEGSTVNVDSAFLGLPNVLPNSEDWIHFPDDLSKIAKNKNDFKRLIDESLNKDIDIDLMKKTYRWLALIHYHSTLKINFTFAPIKNSFFWSFIRYFMKNILKDLDILFYKFFDNGKSLNDLKKNLDIKKFNYLNYPRKNLITEKTEEKLILKNLEFIMNNSQFDFNIKSKLASFLAKGNIKK